MSTIVDALHGRSIGTVEFVSGSEIVVLLNPDAPQATALNTGTPAGFPRLNGYVLVPNEVGATLGLVVTVRIDRSAFPKRTGMADFGLVDLPFPSRMMTLIPVGTLVVESVLPDGRSTLVVRRGVDVFPCVGDPVIIPTAEQLAAIVEGEAGGTASRIHLGGCPTAAGAEVYVDPNKLFGRHLAVLGNTGAGKSCSVAGLIRWSLEAAAAERTRKGRSERPNARFIVLDPNGEYKSAFDDLGARVFQADAPVGAKQLRLPSWLWNGAEWAAFTGAAPGVQRPVLYEALRRARAAAEPGERPALTLAREVRPRRALLANILASAANYQAFPGVKKVGQTLRTWSGEFAAWADGLDGVDDQLRDECRAIAATASQIEGKNFKPYPRQGEQVEDWTPFAQPQLVRLRDLLDAFGSRLGVVGVEGALSENAPIPFHPDDLVAHIEALATDSNGRDLSQFLDTLTLRLRGIMSDKHLAAVARPEDDPTLEEWLGEYVGEDGAASGAIAIVELSLVPADVLHVVVAALARLVFEAVQRYRRDSHEDLPTVLVLEEAHSFAHRDQTAESAPAAARLCGQVIDRIAREGRKFGLGLVLSSQRPAELSPTVLSQCNSFLLHRIVNDRDQELVRRLVPEGLGAVLEELPSLPSRRAILLGWAAPAPVLVEMRELPPNQRPHSPDPDFWGVWTGEVTRTIDWRPVADGWQQGEVTGPPAEAEDTDELGSDTDVE